MHIHEIAQVKGNFGDMLNGWLWRELLPQVFAAGPQAGAQTRFVGIGTILDRHLPPAALTVVFGTGTGYAPPPADLLSARWRVYGVRGPLSARVLGLPAGAALTDPAILLAAHPAFARPAQGGRAGDRTGTVFIPHWKSLRFGQWREACALAGVEFVDPCGDARAVIRRIAGARKVIAESMHAAIVADAFRVPWVPVVLSREVAPFKWADWARTVGLGYRPLLVGPSAPAEVWRDRVLRHSAFAYIAGLPDASSMEGTAGPPGHTRHGPPGHTLHGPPGPTLHAPPGPTLHAPPVQPLRPLHFDDDRLLRDHARAIARVADPWHWRASLLAEAALKRLARAAPHSDARLRPGVYRALREQAARQLQQVAALDGELSTDSRHHDALQRCQQALQRLAADHAAGRLRPPAAAPPLAA